MGCREARDAYYWNTSAESQLKKMFPKVYVEGRHREGWNKSLMINSHYPR